MIGGGFTAYDDVHRAYGLVLSHTCILYSLMVGPALVGYISRHVVCRKACVVVV